MWCLQKVRHDQHGASTTEKAARVTGAQRRLDGSLDLPECLEARLLSFLSCNSMINRNNSLQAFPNHTNAFYLKT